MSLVFNLWDMQIYIFGTAFHYGCWVVAVAHWQFITEELWKICQRALIGLMQRLGDRGDLLGHISLKNGFVLPINFYSRNNIKKTIKIAKLIWHI